MCYKGEVTEDVTKENSLWYDNENLSQTWIEKISPRHFFGRSIMVVLALG